MARILAIGWVTGLALLYLVRYDGWLWPVQCAQVLWGMLPTLRLGPHFGEFVRGRLADFGCVSAILATAFAVGVMVVGRWLPRRDLLSALVVLAAGLWLTAVAVLVLGAITTSLVRWVCVGAACCLLPAPRRFLCHGVDEPQAEERFDGWTRFLLVCLVASAVLNLLGAMAPPFEYDELEYHLGAPAEYLRAGRIIFLPHNFYSNMPQLTEMLYLLAVATSSDVAAKLLHWSFGVLSALAVYAIAERLWSRRVAVTAAALFYCVPFVRYLSVTARIDLATTFFATLAFGCLLMWRREEELGVEGSVGSGAPHTTLCEEAESAGHVKQTVAPTENSWLWFAAAMVGMAAATKWTAVAVVMLPAFVFLVVKTKSFRPALILFFLSSVFVVPWLVKNWVLTGNPVYPLLMNVWPSQHWSTAQAALFAEKHYPSFDIAGWLQLGERFWQYSFLETGAVPLLLMTAPLVLLVRKADAETRRAGWLFVAAYVGWWLLTFRPWRFLFPALPLAALVGGVALCAFDGEHWMRWAMRGMVGLVFGIGLSVMALNVMVDVEDPETLPPQMSLVQYTLGQVERDEFISRMGWGTLEPIVWMNRHLPAAAKVFYVGEARTYYARNPVVWSTAFDQHVLSEVSRRATTIPQWHDLLHQHGIAYIYINNVELARLDKSYGYLRNVNWRMFYEMLREDAELIHETRRGAVFRLKD